MPIVCPSRVGPRPDLRFGALPLTAQVAMGLFVALGLTETEQVPGFLDRHRGTATRVRKIHERPCLGQLLSVGNGAVQWAVRDAGEPKPLLRGRVRASQPQAWAFRPGWLQHDVPICSRRGGPSA